MSTSTATSKIGAVFYMIWACLHLLAAYSIYLLGRSLDWPMIRGRVFQDTWNLVFFSIIAFSVAATLNWKNGVWYIACTDIEDRKRAEEKLQQESIS